MFAPPPNIFIRGAAAPLPPRIDASVVKIFCPLIIRRNTPIPLKKLLNYIDWRVGTDEEMGEEEEKLNNYRDWNGGRLSMSSGL